MNLRITVQCLVKRVEAMELMSHVNSNKLDNPNLSAYKPGYSTYKPGYSTYKLGYSTYKPGYSTETALLSIKNEVQLSPAQGEPIALVLLVSSF